MVESHTFFCSTKIHLLFNSIEVRERGLSVFSCSSQKNVIIKNLRATWSKLCLQTSINGSANSFSAQIGGLGIYLKVARPHSPFVR